MKRLKIAVATFAVALFGAVALVPVASVSAIDPLKEVCNSENADTAVCSNREDNVGDLLGTIINTMLFLVGAISVVMVIFGGIQYTISTGDSGRVSKAKNTITYAIVGLIVSFLAYAIVNWVLKLF